MRVRILRGEGYRAIRIAARSVEIVVPAVPALRTVSIALVAVELATCAFAVEVGTIIMTIAAPAIIAAAALVVPAVAAALSVAMRLI